MKLFKKKKSNVTSISSITGSSDGHSSSNSSVKESLRHKLKANRRIKQETTMETDPQGMFSTWLLFCLFW